MTMTNLSHKLTRLLPLGLALGIAGCAGGDASGGLTAPPDTLNDRVAPLIEEPDLYKRDGDILYVQNPYTGLNVISLADPARPKVLGRAPVTGGAGGQLFLLQNNLLVVLLKKATVACQPIANLPAKGWENDTEVAVVDATNRSAPAVLGRSCIPGSLVAARTVDNGVPVLYMVTSNPEPGATGSRAISLRLSDPRAPVAGAQVDFPGDGKEILVTPTALIVASASAFDPASARVQFFSTAIDGNLMPRGFLDVIGKPMGRFHMDLAGNFFRIVTFDSRNNTGRLTVLDVSDPDHMKEVGAINRMGSGNLYATRFDGDRAYVIMFRRTDPLYVVDLKDPTKPAIVGELEIPDWSDFLYPRGNRLIGVGRGGGGAFVGLTLFDVTDPTRPKGIHQIQVSPRAVSTSEATLDYRGLTIVDDVDQPYLAVPFSNVTFKTDANTRQLCTVESFLQVVDIGPLGFTVRGKAAQIGPVLRSFVAGASKERLVSISDYEVKSLDVTNRDALPAESPLTVGTDDGIQTTIRATCDDVRSRIYRGYYACSVGAKAPGRNTGLIVLIAGALIGARRRRPHPKAGE